MNFILSWLSAFLIIILTIIYPLRKLCTKYELPKEHLLNKLNRKLRKSHKFLGIVSIVVVYFHCRVAFHETGNRSAFGVLLLVLMILLALSFMLRKLLKKHWMTVHRFLTIILLAITAYHIIFEF